MIRAQSMTTDLPNSFDPQDLTRLVGYDMTKRAADAVYEQSGVGPQDIPVVELHDCFTANELISYEALGLTPEGTAEKFILDGDNTYGGRVVTNPSGGLLSKGTRSAPPGWPSAASSCGSCVVRQVDARWTVPGWVCSTTSGSAERRS